ncbi:hypothetical protein CLF_102732 [Clonorchis sinensis]|uniref:Uncharacterized protein n=1 Tax=Clonorchis sinensis TaxID=79923 RepID=G7YN60_CLOSI|nr:hypothetical protein CLF_102732 [Clonorchis sinensis]
MLVVHIHTLNNRNYAYLSVDSEAFCRTARGRLITFTLEEDMLIDEMFFQIPPDAEVHVLELAGDSVRQLSGRNTIADKGALFRRCFGEKSRVIPKCTNAKQYVQIFVARWVKHTVIDLVQSCFMQASQTRRGKPQSVNENCYGLANSSLLCVINRRG